MIPVEAWQAFGGVIAVLIALGGAVFALQRMGIIKKSPQGAPRPVPAENPASEPSPEARALIEATRTLVEVMQTTAPRAEAMGRIHKRLDEMNREVAAARAEIARVQGELVHLNKTLHLIQEHLLREK